MISFIKIEWYCLMLYLFNKSIDCIMPQRQCYLIFAWTMIYANQTHHLNWSYCLWLNDISIIVDIVLVCFLKLMPTVMIVSCFLQAIRCLIHITSSQPDYTTSLFMSYVSMDFVVETEIYYVIIHIMLGLQYYALFLFL